MLKHTILTVFTALAFVVSAHAQVEELPASAWGNTPPLHVEGKYLVDPYGNKVVLHGVMDTPSAYFNGGRWGWPNPYSTSWAKACVNYFHKLFDALTDSDQGAYCNLFRLHLDPCWTNDPSKTKKDYDAHGNKVDGEANISQFSRPRLRTFLKVVYVPIALDAIKHGMYVIMRPPGVFPGYVEVGDYYNQYIMDVWDEVTKNDSIKKYSGQISIELGNEPVTLKGKGGVSDEKALCDFFQPVVDNIRANGFDGVVWGVGTGWQGNYRDYGKYPLVGKNIGYAVHNYVGWYGGDDSHTYTTAQKQAYANECHNSWPIMDTNPIVITEVDWSPEKEGAGHYDEHGKWVAANYGTWATGTTGRWGQAYRYMLDKYDNVSMTLSGTACLIDIDDYLNTGKVVPAFATEMKKNGLDPLEASGATCMEWYKEWAKQNYARPDLTKITAKLTELTCASDSVACMVGQSIDFKLDGKFEDGLTSKIPTWLCSITDNDEKVCSMVNGKFVAVGEGTSEMNVAFGGNTGEAFTKQCKAVVLPAFSTAKGAVNPSILLTGEEYKGGTKGALKTANGGMGGWLFDAGIDLNGFNYLVVNFYAKPKCAAVLYISDNDDPTAPCYTQEVTSNQIVVDLKSMIRPDSTAINLSDIKLAAFKTNGSDYVYLKSAFLSNDGINPAEASPVVGIETPQIANATATVIAEEYFTVSGQRNETLSKGVNIVRQTLSDGTKKTIKVISK